MSDMTTLLALGAIAGVGTWGYLAFERDLRASRERLRGTSHVVETRCGPIEYAEAGAGPPILVVHGAGGGFDQGMEFGRPLVERGFRVIAMSRFGYLQTPMPTDASPPAQADAHLALMDALGIGQAAVFGGSAGAPSAMQFAIRYPARCQALVLLVPLAYRPVTTAFGAPGVSSGLERVLMSIVSSDLSFWLATKFARNTVVRTVLATPPELLATASVEDKERVHRVMSGIQPISRRARGILNDASIGNSLTRFDLEKVRAPTLVLSVRDDLYGTFASAEYTAQQIRGARFVGYQTGGHMWVGHHSDVMAQISAFLQAPSTQAAERARV